MNYQNGLRREKKTALYLYKKFEVIKNLPSKKTHSGEMHQEFAEKYTKPIQIGKEEEKKKKKTKANISQLTFWNQHYPNNKARLRQ